ncbi:LETM1-like protein-domain-containing protein [Phlyctochytrium arcticum]|nr:LETM1-like protein-domain-containing protein [Phlyctochytrium arcticum]
MASKVKDQAPLSKAKANPLPGSISSALHKAQASAKTTPTTTTTHSLPRRVFESGFANPAMHLAKGYQSLYGDVRVALYMLVEYLKDRKPFTRRVDIRHIMRLKRDMMVVWPTTVVLAVPFLMPLVQAMIRGVPSWMPSAFVTDEMLSKKAEGLQRQREQGGPQVLASLAKLPAPTTTTSTPTPPSPKPTITTAKPDPLINLHRRFQLLVSNHASRATASDLIALNGYIRDHASIVDLPSSCLRPMAAMAGTGRLMPMSRLYQWADWILKDDKLLHAEGITSLTRFELIEALSERGFTNLTAPDNTLRAQLTSHLKFSKLVTETLARAAAVQALKTAGTFAGGKRTDSQQVEKRRELQPLGGEEIATAATMFVLARALKMHDIRS